MVVFWMLFLTENYFRISPHGQSFNRRVIVLVNDDENWNAEAEFKEIVQWTRCTGPNEIAAFVNDMEGRDPSRRLYTSSTIMIKHPKKLLLKGMANS